MKLFIHSQTVGLIVIDGFIFRSNDVCCCWLQWEPCQEFLPKLIESYKKLKKAGKRFEIILASSNGDEKSFDESFKDMPWLAFPFEDGRIIELDEHFDVKGKYCFGSEVIHSRNVLLFAPLYWALWKNGR